MDERWLCFVCGSHDATFPATDDTTLPGMPSVLRVCPRCLHALGNDPARLPIVDMMSERDRRVKELLDPDSAVPEVAPTLAGETASTRLWFGRHGQSMPSKVSVLGDAWPLPVGELLLRESINQLNEDLEIRRRHDREIARIERQLLRSAPPESRRALKERCAEMRSAYSRESPIDLGEVLHLSEHFGPEDRLGLAIQRRCEGGSVWLFGRAQLSSDSFFEYVDAITLTASIGRGAAVHHLKSRLDDWYREFVLGTLRHPGRPTGSGTWMSREELVVDIRNAVRGWYSATGKRRQQPTQEQIASRLKVSKPTLARALKKFELQGVAWRKMSRRQNDFDI